MNRNIVLVSCALLIVTFCHRMKGNDLFTADPALDGFECSGEYAVTDSGNIAAKTVSKCAQLCTGYSECIGFYYKSDGNKCMLCNHLFDPPGTTSLLGSRYFIRTLEYTYHELANGKTFRIFSETDSFSGAQSRCEETNGTLVRIRSMEEMDVIDVVLRESPSFDSSAEFWTDGTYKVLGWDFSDGTLMSMVPGGMWSVGSPNGFLVGQHCARLMYTVLNNYRWDDDECDSLISFICEYNI